MNRWFDIRPGEGRKVFWSFLGFFFVLSSYYVLRPLRDEKAAALGVRNLPWLFSATWVVMAVVVPLWAALVARVPRTRILSWAYRLLSLQMLGFWWLLGDPTLLRPAGLAFFMWVSVFALIAPAGFWAVMTDTWDAPQGKRLFGVIAAGGSAGALAGPAMASALVGVLGPERLVLVAAGALEAAVFCVGRALRQPVVGGSSSDAPVGGGVLGSIRPVLKSPYLRGVAVFLLLTTFTGTFAYTINQQVVIAPLQGAVARTRTLAHQALWMNALTIGLQAWLAGWLLGRRGVTFVLALLPPLSALGFAAVAMVPLGPVVYGLEVGRRALGYGLGNPAFSALFSVTSREEKYKARAFIDTLVYRGGDVIASWALAGLMALGLGVSGVAWVAVAVSLPWLALALFVGGRQEKLAAQQAAVPAAA